VSQKINIVTPLALSETSSATLCAPWFVQRTEFPPMPASYRPLVNGKEAFGAVYDAILAAKHTVDIICYRQSRFRADKDLGPPQGQSQLAGARVDGFR
jgi:hypothetical protein